MPRGADPGYLAGDGEEDPLARALSDKTKYQQIRALPSPPGGAVLFTHRILHWGSAGHPDYQGAPRVSFSFTMADQVIQRLFSIQRLYMTQRIRQGFRRFMSRQSCHPDHFHHSLPPLSSTAPTPFHRSLPPLSSATP